MRLNTKNKLIGAATTIAVAVGLAISVSVYSASDNEDTVIQVETTQNYPLVSVVKPDLQHVTEWDDYVGRFEAIDQVQLRSRVSGHLVDIHFEDGQQVEKGQILFTIDQRPFKTQVAIAQAQVADAQARVNFQSVNDERLQNLLLTNAVSRTAAEQSQAELARANAALQSAKAQLEHAELELAFTEIKAPIAGRIDRHYIDIGNLITANDTSLTNIVSMDNMFVTFDVDQNAYLKYSRYHQDGTRTSSRDEANPVLVALGDSDDFTIRGHMEYVANSLDNSTATIRARALVENKDGLLTPGLFARVKLLSRENVETMLIPDKAVTTQQSDRVVFVVDENNVVNSRKVELGPLIDGQRVIRAGLDEDEHVIISGFHRARPGSVVAMYLAQENNDLLSAR
ncbi:MAG: efflux RND transporter periplasmic adaptor subunit [Pseudomonadota bacterium]